MLLLPSLGMTVDLMLPVGVRWGRLWGTCLCQALCWQLLVHKHQRVYIVRSFALEVPVCMPA